MHRAHRKSFQLSTCCECAGNYAAGLKALIAAKAAGFSDVVYLDARTDTNLEELSAANIFVVKVSSERVEAPSSPLHQSRAARRKLSSRITLLFANTAVELSSPVLPDKQHAMQGKSIKTPPLVGTILPGVTRASVLQMANEMGFEATEENVSVSEALQADEVFTTGALAQAFASLGRCTRHHAVDFLSARRPVVGGQGSPPGVGGQGSPPGAVSIAGSNVYTCSH
jgi:branched-chain amino acid aminotransferase